MPKYIRHKSKKKDGITLIALVITIIVLLILAGISISMLSGDNSILSKATQARDETEIAEEKEMIKMASMQALIEKKHGNITKTELFTQLENVNSSKPTSVDSDEELNILIVTFKNSGRVYQIDSNGNVTYIGQEQELKNTATITASPESNTTPQLVQYVDLKIETFLKLDDDEIFVHYAWTNEENKTPSNSDYASAICNVNSNKKRRSVTLTNEDTAEGNYYLWIQVAFNENTITKKYGPYAVKDHTTLVATNTENNADSGFLGNTEIPRNKIRSVTIKNSFGTHGADEKSWDVSASQNRTYLAWSKATTDETDGTYYDVVIEGKGGVVANTNSSWLFAHIGSGLTDQEVTITGLEHLDTGLTTNMERMFYDSKTKTLDLSKFNTSNVTNMVCMFDACKQLRDIDISNFNTSKVKNMRYMFYNCVSLENIDVKSFDTNNVTNMNGMFCFCNSIKTLDVTKFNTCNVTNMSSMFNGCSGLTSLDVTNFNTNNVTNMSSMFKGCNGLTSLDVTKFNTSNVVNMTEMFRNCSSLGNLNVTHFDTKNVLYMNHTFFGCHALTNLNVNNFDTSNVITMDSLFAFSDGLTELDLKNFDTSNVESMSAMFYGCSGLTSIDISSFNTNKVTNMSQMFCGPALTSIDISNFDTRNVINMSQMFYSSITLKTIYVGDNWDTSNVTSSDSMFTRCNNLVGDIPFNSSYIDKTYATKTGGYMTYKPLT